jgi:hypothetical protein
MRGAIPPLPQYVFMAWYLVKQRDNFPLPLPLLSLNTIQSLTPDITLLFHKERYFLLFLVKTNKSETGTNM